MLYQYGESHTLGVTYKPKSGADSDTDKSALLRLDDIEGDSAIFFVKDFETREKF